MGYDSCNMPLEAEEIININMPAGRPGDSVPPVQDSQFIEIDVTDQVNWILSHTGENRGTYSGQYAVVFLTPIGMGSTGKFYLYANEACDGPVFSSENPWTQDGNTMHLVVESNDLHDISVEKSSETSSLWTIIFHIFPNPFNPSTSISYNLGPGRTGTLQIFDIRGKMVFERAVQGAGTVVWDAAGLGSGIYVFKVISEGKIHSRKLVLQR